MTVINIISNATIVKINVYALFLPVGVVGVNIWFVCGFITAAWHRRQTNSVWSHKTQKMFNQLVGVFMVLGLFFAIGTYQWLTSELDAHGYVYSEEKSTLSAMGKHEVYIKP